MKIAVTFATTIAALLAGTSLVQAAPKESFLVDVAVKASPGTSLEEIIADTGAESGEVLVATRNLYELTIETEPANPDDAKKVAEAREKALDEVVKDAEVEWAVELTQDRARDERFHAWPATAQQRLESSDLANQFAFADLELDAVHARATGDGTIVAVLDTGVQQWHPLLRDRVIPGYDLVNGDDHAGEYADGRDNDRDGRIDEAHGHGTFVAGIVAQIAPDAEILPVRVLDAEGDGHLYAIIDGIDYAVEHDADVINLSFGLGPEVESDALEDAVKRARKAGVIVVAAAGNNGDEREHFPASVDGVISVTALGVNNEVVAEWATRGKWVTVAAPGFDIVSSTTEGQYSRWAGTSMAAPVVSAGYALIVEHRPDDDAKKIESILLKSTRKLLAKDQASEGRLDLLDAVS